MKTRIKVVQQRNGVKYYYPQVRWILFWVSCDEYGSRFDTLKNVQEYLDSYTGNKITNISYMKYP